MTGAIPLIALLLIVATINAVATTGDRLVEAEQEYRNRWH